MLLGGHLQAVLRNCAVHICCGQAYQAIALKGQRVEHRHTLSSGERGQRATQHGLCLGDDPAVVLPGVLVDLRDGRTGQDVVELVQ